MKWNAANKEKHVQLEMHEYDMSKSNSLTIVSHIQKQLAIYEAQKKSWKKKAKGTVLANCSMA